MNKIAMYQEAALFMSARAHMWHLDTNSYAAHKALQKFYEDLPDLVDAFAEASMSYQMETLQPSGGVYRFDTSDMAVSGLEQFLQITKQVHSECQLQPGLTNALENIISLIESTLYKLKHLR